MKAVRIHQWGGAELMRYEDVPIPQPSENEVLVKVAAAGVNPVDWKIRDGYLSEAYPMTLPVTLGMDFSGTIEAVGSGVTGFKAGAPVFGCTSVRRPKAYAEYLTIDAGACVRKPDSITHEEAAAFSTGAETAWLTFNQDNINLKAGQTVLIHGGAGGVGIFAIQIAKALGAKVIATGSARNQEFMKELGADITLDYTQQRFEDFVENVDCVFDAVGGETLARSLQVVKPGGVLASIVQLADVDAAERRGVKAVMVYSTTGTPPPPLVDMLANGVFKIIISEILPLEEAAKALTLSETGHVRGKIVLRVAP